MNPPGLTQAFMLMNLCQFIYQSLPYHEMLIRPFIHNANHPQNKTKNLVKKKKGSNKISKR